MERNAFDEVYLLIKDLYSSFIVSQMHAMGMINDEAYKVYLTYWAKNLEILGEESAEENNNG